MNPSLNPRVLIWLAAVGLRPSAIVRLCGEDVPLVKINGERNLWTIFYSEWITARWHEWAAKLGFTRGAEPWRVAQREGHSADEFDRWLREVYG